MTRRLLTTAAAVLMAFAVGGCNAQLLTQSNILDLDSNQMVDPTGNFTLAGSWELKFNYDCSKQHSEGMAGLDRVDLIVYNSDDNSTNFEHPEVHLTGRKQNEVLKFKRGGTFHVYIDTQCDWRLSVIDTNGSK